MENLDLKLFLNEILQKYGYDFTEYSPASMNRRVIRFLNNNNLADITKLNQYIYRSSSNFEFFIQELTVNVTDMFRDPAFFLSLREKVFPLLSTYPYIKIWDAGCSTGEELYSLCILLKEENLLDRTKIYATDLNQKVLHQAKEGIFLIRDLPQYKKNYKEAGGKLDFSDYYQILNGKFRFNNSLTKNVVYYPHNLATDSVFNEFHLIICRNVLIYFTKNLQERVIKLFYDSMVPLGYLGLGKKESLSLSEFKKSFEESDKEEKIFRRIN